MKIIGIVPARLASSRFPKKPLVKILGKSMIEHVYRRSKCARLIDDVYVATCDQEIVAEVERFGGRAIMTSSSHTRGTDRVAEAARLIDADIVINIQGDEPMVCPDSLDSAITKFTAKPDTQCLNIICPITDWAYFLNPNVVKAVVAPDEKVLYFSRQPIPHTAREKFKEAYKQTGIYLFKKEFLMAFSEWAETPLEQAESIDMMRILEHGHTIQTCVAKDILCVDTPQDLEMVERALSNDPLHQRIFLHVAS